MQWQDLGWILNTKPFSERAVIVDILTKDHGKVRGLVKSSRSKHQSACQAGVHGTLTWKARLQEHLGQITLEPQETILPALFSNPTKLVLFNATANLLKDILPENHPYPALFESVDAFFQLLKHGPVHQCLEVYVLLELDMLEDLGFGLDLSQCALTGKTENLRFVSPNTGCAATYDAALPYADKLLSLPAFLVEDGHSVDDQAITKGLQLTGHFLEQHFYPDKPEKFAKIRAGLLKAIHTASQLSA